MYHGASSQHVVAPGLGLTHVVGEPVHVPGEPPQPLHLALPLRVPLPSGAISRQPETSSVGSEGNGL